jgi:hypothetical protein
MSATKTAIRRDREGKDHQMTLVGEWMELCAYYSGDDGNAWSYQNGRWVNQGDFSEFKIRALDGRYRGKFNFD